MLSWPRGEPQGSLFMIYDRLGIERADPDGKKCRSARGTYLNACRSARGTYWR